MLGLNCRQTDRQAALKLLRVGHTVRRRPTNH